MGATSVSVIDVGKGDCILLQAGGSAALIDTGYDATADKVLNHLRKQGVTRLEFVIITHYDRDHVEGLRAIGSALNISVVYLPGYEGSDKNYRTLMSAIADLGLPAQQVTQQLHLQLGDADLELIPSRVAYVPGGKGEEGNDNDLSLVAALTSGNDSYLFTGDLQKDGIEAYLEHSLGQFDVLKVPHHGHKSSMSDELFEDVRPQIAIITDAAHDSAEKKTLKLLNEIGATVYTTSEVRTVVVQGDGAGHYDVSTG